MEESNNSDGSPWRDEESLKFFGEASCRTLFKQGVFKETAQLDSCMHIVFFKGVHTSVK